MESKTQILFTVLMFYTILTVIMGFVGATMEQDFGQEEDTINNRFGVFDSVVTGFSSNPWWVNSILFTPLVIILGWIFISSLPTVNGGA